MPCYRVTAKSFMVLLGFVFWAIAAGLFYVGGFIFYTHGHYDEIASSKFVLLPASIILLVGLLVFVVGIIGCTSVWTESKCLLATFFTILTAVLALLVAACVFAVVYSKDHTLEKKMEAGWKKGFSKYLNDTNWKDEIDYVQLTLQCCGIHNATDWTDPTMNPAWSAKHPAATPGSCCGNETVPAVCPIDKVIAKPGCSTKVVEIFKHNLIWIFTVAALLATALLVGMISSGVVMCSRREGGCRCGAPPDENYETLNEDGAPSGGRGAGLRV